jgi:predicted O-methyltransferase YrrM
MHSSFNERRLHEGDEMETMQMLLPWRDMRIDGGPLISTSLTENETVVLQDMAVDKSVLEIGSAYGYSAIVMAKVAKHVVAVDPHAGYGSLEGSRERMLANLSAYGAVSKVAMMLADSAWALPVLDDLGSMFDLIFIDGDHRRESVRRDVENSLKILAPGGAIVCHDYLEDSCPGVAEAIDALSDEDLLGTVKIVDTMWIYTP